MDIGDGQQRAAIFHTVDGAMVIPDYAADRDEIVVLYATGLGSVDPQIPTGQAGPEDPLSTTTASVSVSVGGVEYPVLWSGLVPYWVGVYQVLLYVPGDRARGDDLPVIVTAGGTSNTAGSSPPPITSIH
jgi:uncharacterized protein (TIGR03437 family)